MNIHIPQAMKPEKRKSPPHDRGGVPIVAMPPASSYRKAGGVRPRWRARMSRAMYAPAWRAGWATPGPVRPPPPLYAARSPMTKTSAVPGSEKSARTFTRPEGSSSAPAALASAAPRGDPLTPAAQTTVRAVTVSIAWPQVGMRPSPAHLRDDVQSVRTITPSRASESMAAPESLGGEGRQDALPPSTSRMRGLAAEILRNSRGGRIGAGEFSDAPGHLDAGQAKAHHHERQPSLPPSGSSSVRPPRTHGDPLLRRRVVASSRHFKFFLRPSPSHRGRSSGGGPRPPAPAFRSLAP